MANSRIMLTCKHCGGQMVLGKGFLGSYHTVEENKAAQLNDFFEKHEKGKCSEEGCCSDNARDHFIILEEGETLDDLPTADVEEVRHGRDVGNMNDRDDWYEPVHICSICDCAFMMDFEEEAHYCPNCGAKWMEGKRND